MKQIITINGFIFIILYITLFSWLCSCELDETDTDEPGGELTEYQSSIITKPTFIDHKERLVLLTPMLEQPFDLNSGSEITFTFNRDSDEPLEIYIFNKKPQLSNLKKGDFKGCLAGISQLASPGWLSSSAVLSNDMDRTQFYACSDSGYPISQTEHVTLNKVLEPGHVYYWFIVGYDDNYMITSSSQINTFTTN